jgi:hypothetical protein
VRVAHLLPEVSMIQTVCPNCSQTVSFRDYLAGFRVKCPECTGFVDVPAAPPGTDPRPTELTEPAQAVTESPFREPPSDRLPEEAFRPDIPAEPDLRKSVWARRLKWVGIALAIPAVAALLAYLLEGGSVWETMSGILAVLLGLISFAFLKEWVTSIRQEGLQPRLLLFLLYCWAVLGVWYGVGRLVMSGAVHVENASGQDVQIELDGRPWRTVNRDQVQQTKVRQGQHRITVRRKEGGNPLQELTVNIEGKGKYLLNVLKAQTYYKGSIRYGGIALFGGGDSPKEVKDEWIDVTKVDYLFEDPPKSITVKVQKGMEGFASETRVYLTRRRPPPD